MSTQYGSFPGPSGRGPGTVFDPALGLTIPPSLQRAVGAMYLGAGIKAVAAVLIIATGVNAAFGAGGFIGGFAGVGLWLWMAAMNKAGKNWARVTGTVFFGIACLGLLADLFVLSAANSDDTITLNGTVYFIVLLDAVNWVAGLYAVIMMWQKTSSAFYNPQPAYGMPGFGTPGIPPYGYPMPYPQGPVDSAAPVPGWGGVSDPSYGQQGPNQQVPGQAPPVDPGNPWDAR